MSSSVAGGATAHRWLDRMVGDWQLVGTMGQVELRQDVRATWALDGRFVEMRCASTQPGADGRRYEAVYFIGYDEASGVLVFHLLDSMGAATSCQVGTGRLDGDSVEFRFEYASGPFLNRFSYDVNGDTWRHDLASLAGGTARPFATKVLTRLPGDER